MEIIKTKDTNITYAENQPQYRPLPCRKMADGMVNSTWKLSKEELEEVNRTGELHLSQSTFNGPLQPVLLTTTTADIYTEQYLEILKGYVSNIKMNIGLFKTMPISKFREMQPAGMDEPQLALSKQVNLENLRVTLETYQADVNFVQSKLNEYGKQSAD